MDFPIPSDLSTGELAQDILELEQVSDRTPEQALQLTKLIAEISRR